MIVSNYWPLFRIRIDRIGTPIISLMCLKEVGIKAIITAKLKDEPFFNPLLVNKQKKSFKTEPVKFIFFIQKLDV